MVSVSVVPVAAVMFSPNRIDYLSIVQLQPDITESEKVGTEPSLIFIIQLTVTCFLFVCLFVSDGDFWILHDCTWLF